jgi:hypothetical protein
MFVASFDAPRVARREVRASTRIRADASYESSARRKPRPPTTRRIATRERTRERSTRDGARTNARERCTWRARWRSEPPREAEARAWRCPRTRRRERERTARAT